MSEVYQSHTSDNIDSCVITHNGLSTRRAVENMLKSPRVLCVYSTTAQNTSCLMASICLSCCSCKWCVYYVCFSAACNWIFFLHYGWTPISIQGTLWRRRELGLKCVLKCASRLRGSPQTNMNLLRNTEACHYDMKGPKLALKWMLLQYICTTPWSSIESYFYFFPLVCRILCGSRDVCRFMLWADAIQDCGSYISSLPTTPSDFLLSTNNRLRQLPSERPQIYIIFRIWCRVGGNSSL